MQGISSETRQYIIYINKSTGNFVKILLVYLCIVDHEGGAGQDEPGPRGEVVEDARRGPGQGHEAGLSSSEADSAAEVEQLVSRHDINSHE